MQSINSHPERDQRPLESFFRSLNSRTEQEQRNKENPKEKHKSAHRQHVLVPKPSLSLLSPTGSPRRNPTTSQASSSSGILSQFNSFMYCETISFDV